MYFVVSTEDLFCFLIVAILIYFFLTASILYIPTSFTCLPICDFNV